MSELPRLTRNQRRRASQKARKGQEGNLQSLSAKNDLSCANHCNQDQHQETEAKDDTLDIDLDSLRQCYFQILALNERESLEQTDPKAAESPPDLVEDIGSELVAAVEGWTKGESPCYELVKTWWQMETLTKYHRGISPEGSALSERMRKKALECLGKDRYDQWKRKNEENEVTMFQKWADDDLECSASEVRTRSSCRVTLILMLTLACRKLEGTM